MPDTFRVGDLVQLKSGGPEMTVDHVVPRLVDQVLIASCLWFDGAQPARQDFPVHTLRKS